METRASLCSTFRLAPAPLRRILRRPSGKVLILAALILLLIVGLSWAAPLITSHDPIRADAMNRLRTPDSRHLLGTDQLGRDVLARTLYGGRPSILIGFLTATLTTILGCLVALAATFTVFDNPIMRLMDGLMAFPVIVLALALVAVLGSSLTVMIIALVTVYTPRMARVARSALLHTKQQEYVEAARSIGARTWRIIVRHVLPNALAAIIVQATFVFAYAIQVEATLSFLGVGVPPEYATWGNVLREGRAVLVRAPWISSSAGLAILVTVLTINILGDALRDNTDPKMKKLVG